MPSPAREDVHHDPGDAEPESETREKPFEEILPGDDAGGDVPRDDGDRKTEQTERSDELPVLGES